MKRYDFFEDDCHECADGEWIRYTDHCEAMKRIAGAPVADEREAFEAWLVSGYLVGGTFEQHYRLMDLVAKREVGCAWKAWQARAALSAGEAQQGLTDDLIQAMWHEACNDGPGRPGWSRHIRFARAIAASLTHARSEDQIIADFLERTGRYVTNDATREQTISDALACSTPSPRQMVADSEQADEDAYVIDRLGKLLAGVAIALKGPELAQHRHSYHDLVEVAEKMALELDMYRTIYGKEVPAGMVADSAGGAEHVHEMRVEPPYGMRCKTCGVFADDLAAPAPSVSPAALTDAKADQQADRQYRAAFIAGWNAGVMGDAATLKRVQDRAGSLSAYLETAAASPADQREPPQFDIMGSLENMQLPMEGYDPKQPGYERRRGWNDACRYAMDVFRANGIKPMSATPPAAD